MDLSTKMLWALDNGRARTICYPISVRKKSHSMLEECKHIDQELRNERNANMVRIKQNIFGENRSNHQNENKKDSDEEHQHHRENHIHEMEEEKNGDDELNVLRNEEFLDKECMDIDVVIEGKEMEIEKNESDSISSNQFKELTEAQVTDNDVSNEDIRVNDIDHCINIQTIIQPTASDIDRNYPQNQIVPSESHERQIEKSVSFAMADSFFPHKEVLCSVENEGKDCLPLQMTSSDDLREPNAPITTTPQLQSKKKNSLYTFLKLHRELTIIRPYFILQAFSCFSSVGYLILFSFLFNCFLQK